MEINFFTIWFFISPFIILHLYLSKRRYREKADTVIEHINETWDNDYKKIINTYGSIEEFLESHKSDFNIVRDNVVKIYGFISQINREFLYRTDMLLDVIDEIEDLDMDIVQETIKSIKDQVSIDTNALLVYIRNFVNDEETAHSLETLAQKSLDEIDKKYKNIDLDLLSCDLEDEEDDDEE